MSEQYELPYSGAEIEARLAKLDTLNAEDFDISESLQALYDLHGDDANVGEALRVARALSPETAALYGLSGNDAVVDEALKIANIQSLKAPNGWVNLGGIIIQWGRFVNANNRDIIYFPTPFPTECCAVAGTTDSHANPYGVQNWQKEGFEVYTGGSSTRTGFYIAIGY